jgi:broad specificity phosphatase PhoE
MYKPALFTGGHIETGVYHSDAYSHLTVDEQVASDLLVSGHVNEDGSFTSEMKHCCKELIFIRHVESLLNIGLTTDLDSDISENGKKQGLDLVERIKGIDLSGYVGFVSPYFRCLKTASCIPIPFTVVTNISEVSWFFPDSGIDIPVRKQEFPIFNWDQCLGDCLHFPKETDCQMLTRMVTFLHSLPEKALVVTHGSCVMTLIELALGACVEKVPDWDGSIPNASLSYITQGTLHYVGKTN